MSIHKIGADFIPRTTPKGTGAAERAAERGTEGAPPRRDRADQAAFSAEGLAMAELASSDRLETLQARIANGFYDDPQVADEVARRLLGSGDLDTLI